MSKMAVCLLTAGMLAGCQAAVPAPPPPLPTLHVAEEGLSACSILKAQDWRVERGAEGNLVVTGKALFPTPGWSVSHQWTQKAGEVEVSLRTVRPTGPSLTVVTSQQLRLVLRQSGDVEATKISLRCAGAG